MAKNANLFSFFGSRNPSKPVGFDINLLPLNLSEGRNIGDLSGLFLFTAPKKAENSRQFDVFIVLFHIENIDVSDPQLNTWANILSEAYFSARGSLTMGVSAAVKELAASLAKDKNLRIFPTIFLNIAVIRDHSLLLAHAGPVHSTVISSDHVQNFNNRASLPVQMTDNELSFYTADIHSEDIVLLCPKVPNDWTNASIMEVTGDSPLNAIRFLLDRSGGNLQAAVIQLKTGKGKITFRTKTTITANIQPAFEEKMEEPARIRRRSSNLITTASSDYSSPVPDEERPLLRQRKGSEFFREFSSEPTGKENQSDTAEPSEDTQSTENEAAKPDTVPLTGEKELPGSQSIPYDFSVTEPEVQPEPKKENRKRPSARREKPEVNREKGPGNGKQKKKRKINASRLFLILICGLLIPVMVVSVLFFVYSGRSKNKLHQEYMSKAVNIAQTALLESDVKSRESLWTEVMTYSKTAMNYGNSPAARDLLREAMLKIDEINGGISTVYNYANSSKLPQNINLTEIAASGQYTYALDSTSGSILRFVASGSGLALDNTFTCSPGLHPELNEDKANIQVGPLIDFVLLPSGSPHGFVLAGVDENANVLYCSGMKTNRAGKLKKPETEKFMIKAVSFYNNAMYVLDTQASAVWEFIYSNPDGFSFEPSNYYGSYSPYLSDIIDFTTFREYSYFLKSNGMLLFCDYTGYRPSCQTIEDLYSQDGSAQIHLPLHNFSKIMVNNSPDNSIYIMDSRMQTVLNISAKANFIRCIVPNRSLEEISQFSNATAFGITGQNRLLWGYKNDLYIGNMP